MPKGEPCYEDIDHAWDEISFVKTPETEVEKMNRTVVYEKDKVRRKLIIMRQKLKDMYDYQYPIERRILEDRLEFLEAEFNKFDYLINPFHIQPGLLLDIDITSIKRKKATLDGMANVLNEFLHGVSKGFADAAFASFSRRRSTVRSDIAQSFASDDSNKAHSSSNKTQYLDMLNSVPVMDTSISEVVTPESLPSPNTKKTKKVGAVDKARRTKVADKKKPKTKIKEI